MPTLMQVIVPARAHRTRTPLRGRRVASRGTRPALAPPPAEATQHARERAAGGPEDVARYDCPCGYVFEAPVSASVGCPHCGGAQAW
jgi:hypothetical protein